MNDKMGGHQNLDGLFELASVGVEHADIDVG
jgi:hypothetical protein